MKCPKCGSEEKQHKVGKNPSGSQRYRCYVCGCKYTPEKKPHSYDEAFRKKAVQLYVDGMNLRRIGRHLGVQSSKRIGLIPNINDSKIRQVGNASIEGACSALLSKSKRAELENLVRKVKHCRLETHPSFLDYFVEGCQFKPVESSSETNSHESGAVKTNA